MLLWNRSSNPAAPSAVLLLLLLLCLQVTAASDVVHACTALLSEYTVSDLQDQGSSSLGFW
jgi:hypothetical protein